MYTFLGFLNPPFPRLDELEMKLIFLVKCLKKQSYKIVNNLFQPVSLLLARFRSFATLAANFAKSGENLNFLKYFQVQVLTN